MSTVTNLDLERARRERAAAPKAPAPADSDLFTVEPKLACSLDQSEQWYPKFPHGVSASGNFGYTFLFEDGEVDFRAFSDREDKDRAFLLGMQAAAAVLAHVRDKVAHENPIMRHALDVFVQGVFQLQDKGLD